MGVMWRKRRVGWLRQPCIGRSSVTTRKGIGVLVSLPLRCCRPAQGKANLGSARRDERVWHLAKHQLPVQAFWLTTTWLRRLDAYCIR